jgi:hypothetical protein
MPSIAHGIGTVRGHHTQGHGHWKIGGCPQPRRARPVLRPKSAARPPQLMTCGVVVARNRFALLCHSQWSAAFGPWRVPRHVWRHCGAWRPTAALPGHWKRPAPEPKPRMTQAHLPICRVVRVSCTLHVCHSQGARSQLCAPAVLAGIARRRALALLAPRPQEAPAALPAAGCNTPPVLRLRPEAINAAAICEGLAADMAQPVRKCPGPLRNPVHGCPRHFVERLMQCHSQCRSCVFNFPPCHVPASCRQAHV